MRSYDLIFTAGETKEFNLTNKFLLILQDGGTPIDMNISTDGGVFFPISGVGSGFGFEAPDNGGLNSYTKILFTSSVAQTVKIYTGNSRAQYNRIGGTVTVTGTVKTQEAGTPFTHSYKSRTVLSGGSSDTIFLPSFNTNGIVVNSMQFIDLSTSYVQMGGFYYGTTAPINDTDGCILQADSVTQINSLDIISSGSSSQSFYLPAGKGLYFFSSFTQNTTARSCVFTKL